MVISHSFVSLPEGNPFTVTSCHIRDADPQADFPVVSGNAAFLRLRLRQPDIGSGWKFHWINTNQLYSNVYTYIYIYIYIIL